MNVYERSLFSVDDGDTYFDRLGNSCTAKELPGLSAIFRATRCMTEIPNHIDYKNFSVLIDEKGKVTFEFVSEALLSNMQKIEILLYQLLRQKQLDQQDFDVLEELLELETLRIDGRISAAEYTKRQNALPVDTMDPIIKMINIETLHNFMCDELFHAQYRMIDGFNSQCEALIEIAPSIDKGHEFRSISPYADNAAFSYQDSLKAIFKVLDIFSKWYFYISGYKNLGKKVPQKYFSDFLKESDRIPNGTFKLTVDNLCEPLKVFVLIRNEITHNESLGRNRQVLFIGRGTPEVNGQNLFYSKTLFWDHDDHTLTRASGSLGFFTQNLDTLVETRNFFVNTLKLITFFQEHFFLKIIDGLKAAGVTEPVIWFGYPEKPKAFSIEDIKNQYCRFRF